MSDLLDTLAKEGGSPEGAAFPDNIRAAAKWLLMQDPAPSPIIPALRLRFDLSAKEAVDAIREATMQKGRAT